MGTAFSIASWNVEHFGAINQKTKKPLKPIQPIIDVIAKQAADIIAIYEVRSEYVFRPIVDTMTGYQFHITEGPQMQEILIGIKHGINAFVTQKTEFRSGQSSLRPGVLVTPRVDGEYYPILFLHLKSMADAKGFGLRDDMLGRALRFRKKLDELSPDNQANYMFVGDLNTMGLDYPYTKHDISAKDEIKELDRRLRYRNMKRLSKNSEFTWWNGKEKYSPGSNLDHVIAAEHLKFNMIDGAEVSVRGWVNESTKDKQLDWINTYSDHNVLYFEVQKVS